jgi:two-component system OmpR family response regulator
MRILLIEEDAELSARIRGRLTKEGYICDSVDNLRDGEYYFDIRYYDLVLVDWELAKGTEFFQTVRIGQPKTVIITLSAHNDSANEISALREGADDYLHKPFDMDVLLARIEARLRRSGVGQLIEIEDLTIDTKEETVSYQGRIIELKGKSFDVFAHLARHRNQIVGKEQLLDALWIEPELVTPNVIEVAINQIRQKVDKPLGITTIDTVRRRGYRFCYPQA